MLNFTLGAGLFRDLEYQEVDYYNEKNIAIHKEPVTIKGTRLKGQIKVINSKDGDNTSCSIVYKTEKEVIAGSLIEGREVMECVPLSMSNGYKVYVK